MTGFRVPCQACDTQGGYAGYLGSLSTHRWGVFSTCRPLWEPPPSREHVDGKVLLSTFHPEGSRAWGLSVVPLGLVLPGPQSHTDGVAMSTAVQQRPWRPTVRRPPASTGQRTPCAHRASRRTPITATMQSSDTAPKGGHLSCTSRLRDDWVLVKVRLPTSSPSGIRTHAR